MLSLNPESPEMPESSVLSHLLHALEVLSELGVERDGDELEANEKRPNLPGSRLRP